MKKLIGFINPCSTKPTIYVINNNDDMVILSKPSIEEFADTLIKFSNEFNLNNISIASEYQSFATGIAQQLTDTLQLNYGINNKIIEVIKL